MSTTMVCPLLTGQNAAKALQFIRDSGVKLTNIGKQTRRE